MIVIVFHHIQIVYYLNVIFRNKITLKRFFIDFKSDETIQ